MEILIGKEPSYIRCIKPNDFKLPSMYKYNNTRAPVCVKCVHYIHFLFVYYIHFFYMIGRFDDKIVLHQVKYLGLMENLRVRRAGFAYRKLYAQFLDRYKSLCPETWPHYRGSAKEGVQVLVYYLRYEPDEYRMGK